MEKMAWQQHFQWKDPLPPQLQNPPVLRDYLYLYMKAFRQLSTCRQIGMGPGPIPWTAIVEYARLAELDEVQTQTLHYHIERLDNAYLEWSDKKIKKDTPSPAKPAAKSKDK